MKQTSTHKSQMADRVAAIIQEEMRSEGGIREQIAALADAIERREDPAPDLCRLSDHMQDMCGCRDLAGILRDIVRVRQGES